MPPSSVRPSSSCPPCDQAACVELGPQAASIFSIHAMLLEDASLVEGVLSIIRSRHATAEYAVQTVEQDFSSAFAGMDSPYMRARGRISGISPTGSSAVCWDESPRIPWVTSLPGSWSPTSCCPVRCWLWTGGSCWVW